MDNFFEKFCEEAEKRGGVMTEEVKARCRDVVETLKRNMSAPGKESIVGFYRGFGEGLVMFEADAEDCKAWVEVDDEYVPIENVGVVVDGEIIPYVEHIAKETR
jgi:hypothetical protein